MRFVFLVCSLHLVSSCATPLTEQGSSVRLVQDQADFDCSFVGTVSGSNSLGSSTAHDTDGALNQVRNKAGSMGANAVRVINIDTRPEMTTVAAEALDCKF